MAVTTTETMVQAMHTELGQYHAAQEHERAELQSLAVRGEAAERRLQQLKRVLPSPLRLSAGAIAVGTKQEASRASTLGDSASHFLEQCDPIGAADRGGG